MVWRSVRAHGDTKTNRSRRTLKLPEIAVEALRSQKGGPVGRRPTYRRADPRPTSGRNEVARDLTRQPIVSGCWRTPHARDSIVIVQAKHVVAGSLAGRRRCRGSRGILRLGATHACRVCAPPRCRLAVVG
jgi:hypothetical protein